jgi:hypothetical protein
MPKKNEPNYFNNIRVWSGVTKLSENQVRTSCHSHESGNPIKKWPNWIPAFAGMTNKLSSRTASYLPKVIGSRLTVSLHYNSITVSIIL